MALPEFSLRQLLEAGVHFGHQTHRWNPKMGTYIYGERNGIHIVDLTQTVPLLDAALQAMRDCVAKGGRILFVGTKRQAAKALAEAAERSAQYYMNHRWLGGTLTNWKTVSNSINRLKTLDEQLDGGAEGFTKKERLNLERERAKLQASLGGIREMGGLPDMLFVIDTNKEDLAIAEARKLGIPVVAILDTNSDPAGVSFPIPGNDDASRAIALYTDLAARAVIDGMASQLGAAGFDLGELEDAPVEDLSDAGDDSGDGEAAPEKSDEKSDGEPDETAAAKADKKADKKADAKAADDKAKAKKKAPAKKADEKKADAKKAPAKKADTKKADAKPEKAEAAGDDAGADGADEAPADEAPAEAEAAAEPAKEDAAKTEA